MGIEKICLGASSIQTISETRNRFAELTFSKKFDRQEVYNSLEQTLPTLLATATKVILTIPLFLIEKIAQITEAFGNAAIRIANGAYSAILGDVKALDTQPIEKQSISQEGFTDKESSAVNVLSLSVLKDSQLVFTESKDQDVTEILQSNDLNSVDSEEEEFDAFEKMRLIHFDEPAAPEAASGISRCYKIAAAAALTLVAYGILSRYGNTFNPLNWNFNSENPLNRQIYYRDLDGKGTVEWCIESPCEEGNPCISDKECLENRNLLKSEHPKVYAFAEDGLCKLFSCEETEYKCKDECKPITYVGATIDPVTNQCKVATSKNPNEVPDTDIECAQTVLDTGLSDTVWVVDKEKYYCKTEEGSAEPCPYTSYKYDPETNECEELASSKNNLPAVSPECYDLMCEEGHTKYCTES